MEYKDLGVPFAAQHFEEYCKLMTIKSKEEGPCSFSLNPVQQYLVRRMEEGIKQGKHKFVILKSRQEGITTLCNALSVWWCMAHPGTFGVILAPDDTLREFLRRVISDMALSVPIKYRYSVIENNRLFLTWNNRSQLHFCNASGKESGDLGRGRATTLIHATEMGLWRDYSNYDSLMPSFAKKNPNRLAVFEGTAKGLGLFYELWRTAVHSDETDAVFVGWWLNPDRKVPRGTKLFEKYWNGRLSATEREWIDRVKKDYKIEITEEQVAWYRMTCNEEFRGDLAILFQEYPPLPEYAFQTNSRAFFPSTLLNKLLQKECRDPLRCMRFEYSSDFTQCKVTEVQDEEVADLLIWQLPVRDEREKNVYIIGADPAWGSSDTGCNFAATVWRCWANRVEQVAEFVTPNLACYQFAWTLAYLAGQYGNAFLIIELGGGGASVYQELKRLQSLNFADEGAPFDLKDINRSIYHYLYRRVDSVAGGNRYWHWQTTGGPNGTKQRMMHALKNLLMQGILIPRSRKLLEEMSNIEQDEVGGFIMRGRSINQVDDRAMATALAAVSYLDQVAWAVQGKYWSEEIAKQEEEKGDAVVKKSKTVEDVIYDQFYNHLVRAGVFGKKTFAAKGLVG